MTWLLFLIAHCLALIALLGPMHVLAATTPDSDTEYHRQQEREQAERKELEQTPDVRLPVSTAAEMDKLPVDEKPCFKIGEIELIGNEHKRFAWIMAYLAGKKRDDAPLGRCLGARGINLLLTRAQNALVAKGYVTSRVLAQPQDLSTGKLVMTVIPGRIRQIRFTDPVDPRATAWNAVPAKTGDILNLRDVEQALENFKRVPSAEADIKIEPAEGNDAAPGLSDLAIAYKQAFPMRLSLSADNTGTNETGRYQGTATLSYDNPLKLNDLFYLTYNHDLVRANGAAGARGTQADTIYYSVPVGYWSLSATGSKNKYYQSVAGATQNYIYSGTSGYSELKLSRLVWRDANSKWTLDMAGFQSTSDNFIDNTEIGVQRRIEGGWHFTVEQKQYFGAATLDSDFGYKRGTGAFGAIPAPEQAFGTGTAQFVLMTADSTLNLPFEISQHKWHYNVNWRMQNNLTPLVVQDQFAIGGPYTVRGFDGESTLMAERGWLLRNELGLYLGGAGQEFYVGLDHGEVSGPSAALLVGQCLTGDVMGMRGSLASGKVLYDLNIGAPVRAPVNFKSAGSTIGFRLTVNI